MIYWINEDKLKWNYQKDFDNHQNQAKVFCDSIPPDSTKTYIVVPDTQADASVMTFFAGVPHQGAYNELVFAITPDPETPFITAYFRFFGEKACLTICDFEADGEIAAKGKKLISVINKIEIQRRKTNADLRGTAN